jgi:hypothetical protein
MTSNNTIFQISEINNEFMLDENNISNIISDILPDYALADHTHNISDINNLQTTLDNKLNNNSTINCGTFE